MADYAKSIISLGNFNRKQSGKEKAKEPEEAESTKETERQKGHKETNDEERIGKDRRAIRCSEGVFRYELSLLREVPHNHLTINTIKGHITKVAF